MEQLRGCHDALVQGEDGDLTAEEGRFRERIENLINLMEVFDRVTTALLPFIQEKHAPVIRQLIQMAEALHEGESEETTGDG